MAEVQTPVVRASARYVRTAPRKIRLVADQIRGMELPKALELLEFSPLGASVPVKKLLESAGANAENNHDLIADEMVISEIYVDEGPTLRRWRARARGRSNRIDKRTAHVSVALTPSEDED